MLTPSGSRVCAEAGVPAANAAAVANPSDSADLLSIFVIAVPFGCFGPLGQSLGPWFANYTGYSGEAQPKICMRGLVQNLAKVPGGKCPQRVCAVKRRRFPVGASPTRQPLQPEATGAVMEVTKWLKPLVSVSRIGDSASVQAVTRVNAEQASKRTMRRPTRQPFRGRLIRLGE